MHEKKKQKSDVGLTKIMSDLVDQNFNIAKSKKGDVRREEDYLDCRKLF